ncbi:hypothetical protein CRM22_005656 [Opisthorchis felineus]|uniref:Thioredoxin domain-containing protein n=1 Tax=Opisthorchis felineus TaxID=147828 RepID=A0A4S2LQ56_OPIFE|nr:hypothetical protein CRM22_005656 [Opisthorchis felineus]
MSPLGQSFVRCLSERTSECGITNIQDEADFQKRVINNQKPVLVDFHATWCGPCKLLGPRLEEVMKSHMNSILLAKVDVDQNDTLAATYKGIVPEQPSSQIRLLFDCTPRKCTMILKFWTT